MPVTVPFVSPGMDVSNHFNVRERASVHYSCSSAFVHVLWRTRPTQLLLCRPFRRRSSGSCSRKSCRVRRVRAAVGERESAALPFPNLLCFLFLFALAHSFPFRDYLLGLGPSWSVVWTGPATCLNAVRSWLLSAWFCQAMAWRQNSGSIRQRIPKSRWRSQLPAYGGRVAHVVLELVFGDESVVPS